MGALAAALVSLTLGNWQVTFQEADARLELVNASGEVHISGTLGFTSGDQIWRVAAPHDAVANRLALLDLAATLQAIWRFKAMATASRCWPTTVPRKITPGNCA